MNEEDDFTFDEQSHRLVGKVERSLVRLQLPWQAQIVSLCNALEVQIESGSPVPAVIHHLCEALLSLVRARGLDPERVKLNQRLDSLRARLVPSSGERYPAK